MFRATLMCAILLLTPIIAIKWNGWIPSFEPEEKDPLDGVQVDLGYIDSILDEECNQKIGPMVHKCQEEYRAKLVLVYEKVGKNPHSESLKKTSCCGAWEAKRCVIRALESIECDSSYAARIKNLPIDEKIREDVGDKCSEYAEDSAVCEEESKSSWFSMHHLIIFLVIILAVAFLILVAFRVRARMRQ